jgi:hypothetical protein
MPSSGMLGHMAVVRTDVSEERIVSITRLTRSGRLGTTLAVTSNRNRLRRNTMYLLCTYVCIIYVVFLPDVLRLLVTANVPSAPILVTLMMEALYSSETSVLTRDRRRDIPIYRLRADAMLLFETVSAAQNLIMLYFSSANVAPTSRVHCDS